MEIIKLRPQDEFIKLGQALKAAGLVESGVEAKDVIQTGLVLVNGEIGIFYLNGEAYIKKLQDDKNGVFLVSLNKKYPPIPVGENDRFDILGKVVGKNHPDEIKEYLQ